MRKATAQKMAWMRNKEEEQRKRLFEFHLKNLMDMLNVHMRRMRNGNMHVPCQDLEVMNSAFVNMVDMHPVFGLEARKAKMAMKKKQVVKRWEGVGIRGDKSALLRDHMLQQKQKQNVEYAKQAIREMSVLTEGKQQTEKMKNGGVVDQGSFESCKTTGIVNTTTNVPVHTVGWQQALLQQQSEQREQQYHQQQYQPHQHYDRAGMDMYMGMMMKNMNQGPTSTIQQQQIGQGEEQAGMRALDPNQSATMFKKLQKELLESLQAGRSVDNNHNATAAAAATRGISNQGNKSADEKQLMQLICSALSPTGGQHNSRIPREDEMQNKGKRTFDDDKDAASALMSLGSAPLEKRPRKTNSPGFRPVRANSAQLTNRTGFLPVSNNTNYTQTVSASPHVNSQNGMTDDGNNALSNLYSLLAQVAGPKNVTRPPPR
jgi:hypothetical protein